ncbi:gliding motility-associated C-terminal domain-containing protein [Winogradskyella sp. A3E31]|uniref:T9SS type B sorting domain-containing protein n=1 Tax=Winogradskyella sp. A3E31 TaxID=3349637 RepID=UPI00398A9197
MKLKFLFYFFIFGISFGFAQDIALYSQFNGRYDYIAIGNTMNLQENGNFAPCDILTSSSANLNLDTDQTIVAAYLYWAGSGSGDFDIELNGNPVTAERTFSDALDTERIFFAAFTDVTTLVLSEGTTNYTLSELDISDIIGPYCPTGTNFAGWAITVIYEDPNLPLNQLNVYDGLQSVPENLTINLDNLNVLDNEDAKIGFVAWEGDVALAVNEQLTINGNVISNPPLNPANNAFNGTNSFTEQSNLFNMDIDVYNIQNNISIGDTSATINLTSGQDFVMINNVITVLNSQLPDATVNLDNLELTCDSRTITIGYTVSNTNSTDVLPANTPIAFYADGQLVAQAETLNDIPIGSSETVFISITIPETVADNFQLTIVVDDDGTSNGIVTEISETNNHTTEQIELLIVPENIILPTLIECNEGFEKATFNLFENLDTIETIELDSLSFYETIDDLEAESNSILNPGSYTNLSNPQTIFIRRNTEFCYEIFEFQLEIENCPPEIPEGFSPNNDNKNDWFNIRGLYDIFIDHKLLIYNRYGTLIYEGDNESPWLGLINRGLDNKGNRVPVGTYYYVLNLNDPEFKPSSGWVYVNY